jgi:hypothetical protein
MVEFWASVGLACFDPEFLKAVSDDDEMKAVKTIRNYMLRLGCNEFEWLRKLVMDPDRKRAMQALARMRPPDWPAHRFAGPAKLLRTCRPPVICP